VLSMNGSLRSLLETGLYVLWAHSTVLLRTLTRSAAATTAAAASSSIGGVGSGDYNTYAGLASLTGAVSNDSEDAVVAGVGAIPVSARMFIVYLQDTIIAITAAFQSQKQHQKQAAAAARGGASQQQQLQQQQGGASTRSLTHSLAGLTLLPAHVYLASIEASDIQSRGGAAAVAAAAAAAAAASGTAAAGAGSVGLIHAASAHYGLGVDTLRACARALDALAKDAHTFAGKLGRLLQRDIEPALAVCAAVPINSNASAGSGFSAGARGDNGGEFAFAQSLAQSIRVIARELVLRAELAAVTRDVLTKACEDMQTTSSIFI